jgi:hypothetical protein
VVSDAALDAAEDERVQPVVVLRRLQREPDERRSATVGSLKRDGSEAATGTCNLADIVIPVRRDR